MNSKQITNLLQHLQIYQVFYNDLEHYILCNNLKETKEELEFIILENGYYKCPECNVYHRFEDSNNKENLCTDCWMKVITYDEECDDEDAEEDNNLFKAILENLVCNCQNKKEFA